MRIIPNQSEKRFISRLMKNGQKSIRLNLIHSVTSIRVNPNQSETKFSFRINLNHSDLELIRIDVSELIELSRIDFWPLFIKRDTKRFLDWFGMIRIGSDTDIGIVLIDSE